MMLGWFGCMDAARFEHGTTASGPFVAVLRILTATFSNCWCGPELLPGQHLPHHPVDLWPRDPGHLFPPNPVAGSAGQKLRPAGTGPCGDASQPSCGSRTRPGLRHPVLRLELRFNAPDGSPPT